MAWISVHESAVGSKLRDLAKEFDATEEEALGTLVKLWLWGLENADIDGRIWRADREDILDAFSLKLVKKFKFEKIIDTLVKTRWLDELGDGVYAIHDWEIWQEQWYKAKERRENDARRKRESRRRRSLALEPAAPETQSEKADGPQASPQDAPQDEGAGEDPPAAKPARKKPQKVKYAEFVSMPEESYQKLVERYGAEFTQVCIVELDNYKGSKGKKYADDYRAILSWVVDRVNEKRPGLMRQSMSNRTAQAANTADPFAEYGEGEQ